jgi:predicted tellurium resistance membrane protein TerC
VSALILRGVMIGVGVVFVETFHWALYLFGAFLLLVPFLPVLWWASPITAIIELLSASFGRGNSEPAWTTTLEWRTLLSCG